jgi:methylated-DNA-[protein]-cysteine S-methyltransferase
MTCGANPLAVIIPCHRVVAVNGPGGFAGGVAIKKALLALEHTAAIL